MTDSLLAARALVLHDLQARDLGAANSVDVLENALSERKWWIEQWPEGADYVAGQVAQDVQDQMLDDNIARWPLCTACDETSPHELHIDPELGPDPHWLCEKSGIRVAPLGHLD